MHAVVELYRDPIFRHELRRPERRRVTRVLAACTVLYVAAFTAARSLHDAGIATGTSGYTAEFDFAQWLFIGVVLLSVSVHWLTPLSVLVVTRNRYELRTLSVLMGHGADAVSSLRAQILGSVAPLAAAATPLLAMPFLLSGAPVRYSLFWLAVLVAAVLWGSFVASASFWCGITVRHAGTARVCAYLLTTFVFPLAIAGLSVAVGFGCSAGQKDADAVFWAGTAITWILLVLGAAATFWDLAIGQVFPRTRRSLWVEVDEATPLES